MRILRRYTFHDRKLQRQQPVCESNLVFLRTFGGLQSCIQKSIWKESELGHSPFEHIRVLSC